MIHDLRPYPRMKDSGVPWLGQVPEHWGVVPNRAVFQEINERGYGDEQMLSVTITQGIIKQRELLDGSSKKDSSRQDKSAYKLVSPGDIAYNKMRAWQGALGASPLRGIVSPAYVVVRPRDENNPAYFHYLMRTPTFAKEAERWSYGITSDMWSLRPEHFRLIYTVVPPPDEQGVIVRFLDHADRRIRKAIAAKQKLIRLLQEQKQVIIHQAVTRGLDPNVRLKPSGVEWLGDVPAHWKFVRGKYLFQQTEWPVESNDEIVTCFRDGQVTLRRLRRETGFMVALKEGGYQRVVKGQLVIHAMDAFAGAIGVAEASGKCTPEYIVLDSRNHPVSPEFYAQALRIAAKKGYILMMCPAVRERAPRFRYPSFGEMLLPVPPYEEQVEITKSIDLQTQAINQIIERTKREQELLGEYRTRLIADVVTGKLDVREAALLLPEPEHEAVSEELGGEEAEGLEGEEGAGGEEE